MSAPVSTPTTPGAVFTAERSIDVMVPWATEDRPR